jgi:hypothetical protein
MTVKELARQGANTRCVDCAAVPLFGGLRCLTCFQRKADERQVPQIAERPNQKGHYKKVGKHTCTKHEPAVVCYIKCKCRCIECLRVMTDYRQKHPR